LSISRSKFEPSIAHIQAEAPAHTHKSSLYTP